MDDRRVVAAGELARDLWQWGIRQLSREIHRDLARIDDVLRAALAAELLHREPEAVGDRRLDALDRDFWGLTLREDVLEHVLGELDRHRPAGQAREGDDAGERAFELADVGRGAAGD